MPKMHQGKRIILRLLVMTVSVAIVYILDLIIKENISIAVWNKGISLGISIWNWLPLITLILIFMSIYWIRGEKNIWMLMVLAGGWVNNYYRYTGVGVLDYWRIPWVNLYNNIADWVIFLGVIAGIIDILKSRKNEQRINGSGGSGI